MWPWEHAIVGYLVFSLAVHLFRSRPPTDREAIAVVFASLLPDLIDKPLAWEFGVFSSGYGIGHSVFFAVPLSAAVVLLAIRTGRDGTGVAFATGYLLHLPADLFPHLLNGRFPVERVLWPLATSESSYPDGFTGTFRTFLGDWLADLLTWPPSTTVAVMAGGIVGCGLLWAVDGLPGLRGPAYAVRRLVRRRLR